MGKYFPVSMYYSPTGFPNGSDAIEGTNLCVFSLVKYLLLTLVISHI